MKALRWIALGAGALALVAAAAITYLVATFDPNAAAARVAELVKRHTGRTLAVAGPVSLTFIPKLGVALSKVTVSERNGPATFARVDEARVAVALLPLLSGRVVADRIALDGLTVDLVRRKDGHTNFDDLAGREPGPAEAGGTTAARAGGHRLAVDVRGVALQRATIGWRDEGAGLDLRLSDVSATTGRLAAGAAGKLAVSARVRSAQPVVDVRLALSAAYRLDLDAGTVAISAVEARATGRAEPLGDLDARAVIESLAVDATAARATAARVEISGKTAQGLDATATVPRLVIAPERVESEAITATVALASPPRHLSAKIRTAPLVLGDRRAEPPKLSIEVSTTGPDLSVHGALATPLAIDLDARRAELTAIAGELTLTAKALPAPAKGTVRGSSRVDWVAESASADLAVAVDGSHVDAKLGVARWDRPAFTFAVVADRLDLDRYVPRAKPASGAAGGSSGSASGRPASAGRAPSGHAPVADEPIDFSPLRDLTATGTVKIGALRAANVKAENVAFTVRAAGGVARVDPIAAALYGGRLAGRAVIDANERRIALAQRLTGVDMNPLLRDLTGEDLLEGRGDVALDVTAAGATVGALERALSGTTGIAVKDGALKGVDVPAIVGAAQSLLGSKHTLERPGEAGARTPFSDLHATFQIKNGVAHNEDLQVTSPLLRIAGRGNVDIAAATVDYTMKATFTAAPSAVGKDLARLVGATVPIHTTGPLARPTHTVDVAALAAENVKTLVPRELQRQLGGGATDGQGGTQGGAVGDLLRDLIGGKPKRPK